MWIRISYHDLIEGLLINNYITSYSMYVFYLLDLRIHWMSLSINNIQQATLCRSSTSGTLWLARKSVRIQYLKKCICSNFSDIKVYTVSFLCGEAMFWRKKNEKIIYSRQIRHISWSILRSQNEPWVGADVCNKVCY